jgi:hypothetical protein
MVPDNSEDELNDDFEFYGNHMGRADFLAAFVSLICEHKCPFCKESVTVPEDGNCKHVWKCRSNPANRGRRITVTGANHASAVEYAADTGLTVEGAINHGLERFFATAGLSEREGAIERKLSRVQRPFPLIRWTAYCIRTKRGTMQRFALTERCDGSSSCRA